jgi:curved DNA-binding protein CbpA
MFFFPKRQEEVIKNNPPELHELYRPTNSTLLDNKNPLEQSSHLDRQVTSYNFNTNNQVFDRPTSSMASGNQSDKERMPEPQQQQRMPEPQQQQRMPEPQQQQRMPEPQQQQRMPEPQQQQRMPEPQQQQKYNLENYDPYDILGIDSKSDVSQIRSAYKKLATQHHPDKGGNPELFDLITKSYQLVLRRAENIKPQKKIEHNDLKKGSDNFMKKTESHVKKSFNLDNFNSVYDGNKMKNPYDSGYGNWNDEIKNENLDISSNVNSTSFNTVFEQSRQTNSYNQQVQTFKEPDALASGDLNFSELGIDNINTFTKNEGDGKSINFTDYKDAYTIDSKLIDPNSIKIDESPQNIKKMELERSNISYEMNEDYKRQEEIKLKQLELQEHNRLQKVNMFDEMASEQYNKVNRMMLGNQ